MEIAPVRYGPEAGAKCARPCCMLDSPQHTRLTYDWYNVLCQCARLSVSLSFRQCLSLSTPYVCRWSHHCTARKMSLWVGCGSGVGITGPMLQHPRIRYISIAENTIYICCQDDIQVFEWRVCPSFYTVCLPYSSSCLSNLD